MVSAERIKEILHTAEADIFATTIFPREIYPQLKKYFLQKTPVVLQGIRRCGKTYLMYQLFREFKESCYLNFEDERLIGLTAADLETIHSVYIGMKSPQRPVMFLDEVQNVKGWEKFVSRLHSKVKFVISGSNATLLSSEFATVLTGRYIPMMIYPLSFKEYVLANVPDGLDLYHTEQRARIMALFSDYMNYGGFPQASMEKNTALIRSYFDSIVFRDIVSRFAVQHAISLEIIARYLVSNPGKLFSFRNLCSVANIRHEDTVQNYIGYIEKAYLLSSVYKFEYSLRKQVANQKKAYPADTGFTLYSGTQFSPDSGRLLEIIVYNDLKRRYFDVFYWRNERGKEVDFVVCDGLKPRMMIQVTEKIENDKQLSREITPLLIASAEHHVKDIVLLTMSPAFYSVPSQLKQQSIIEWLLA